MDYITSCRHSGRRNRLVYDLRKIDARPNNSTLLSDYTYNFHQVTPLKCKMSYLTFVCLYTYEF
jgi:hypothetical protein